MNPQWINDAEGNALALLVPAGFSPTATTFLTGPDAAQQVGFIVRPAGDVIRAHAHLPGERRIVGTPEVLFVRSGRLEVTLFDLKGKEAERRTLTAGDLLLLVGGGHGFKTIEDTTMIEVKQGPFIPNEKVFL